MVRIFFLLAFLSCVAGCAGMRPVHSDVVAFHDLDGKPLPKTYAFGYLKGQESSLEVLTYQRVIEGELANKGMNPAPTREADVIVYLNYHIDGGRSVFSNVPIWGQTGTTSSYTSGTISTVGSTSTLNATTTYTPIYGVTGSQTVARTEYARQLILFIYRRPDLDAGNMRPVYEGTVKSSGSGSSVAAVIRQMSKALFEDFPGKSGKLRRTTNF